MMIDFSNFIYIKQILVALIWAGTFIAGRILSQDHIPAGLSALLRFALASILLVLLVFYTEKRWIWISKRSMLITAGMGLTGIFIYNLFFFSALEQVEAGRTALFASLAPILTVLFSSILFKERLNYKNYLGVILAFIGAIVIVTRGHLLSSLQQSIGVGEIFISCAVMSWVAYTLISRKNDELSPLLTITYASLWGTLFLFLSSLSHLAEWQQVSLSVRHSLAIFYTGAIGTVLSFVWYAQGITQLGASKAVIFTNLVPVFAVVLSILLLNEQLHWSMLLGGSAILLGIYLTNLKTPK